MFVVAGVWIWCSEKRSTAEPVLHRTRPRELFLVARSASGCATGISAGPVSNFVRPRAGPRGSARSSRGKHHPPIQVVMHAPAAPHGKDVLGGLSTRSISNAAERRSTAARAPAYADLHAPEPTLQRTRQRSLQGRTGQLVRAPLSSAVRREERRTEGRIEPVGFVRIGERVRRLDRAHATFQRGRLTVRAIGPKGALDLVNVPFPVRGPAELPGSEAILECPSFLDGPTAYVTCRDVHQDLYFPVIVVRCVSFDRDSRMLTITFGGPVLEQWWDAAIGGDLDYAPFASGQLCCRVADSRTGRCTWPGHVI
jgi:hypothetical protein